MRIRQQHVFLPLALAVFLFPAGCHKKKPPLPAAANAPTLQPQPHPVTPATTTTPAPAPKPKPKPHAAKKTAPPQPAVVPKNPSVITEGGTTDTTTGQISTADTGSHPGLTTEQVLAETDDNLRKLTRQLTPDEQAIVQQIRDYEKQSRAAITQGDSARAYNLATKAHLLSEELVNK